MKTIKRIERAPGGYEITVEVAGAYSDGRSREDKVFVDADEVDAAESDDALLAIVAREVRGNRLRRLRGRDLDKVTPAPAREALSRRLERLEGKVDAVSSKVDDIRSERAAGGSR